ncbi:hypothetical protein CANARDRAFT_213979 [[Candida] arabinofermentans NRRL YB-2248]|uniref:HORMA domain-containing protein n=1 Tax=[Candida] arabinofermentans NRRL YB-2248 TaxID=983967 RepID=A0A1E4SX80_9ASCO|nr:hypothetical protein CANARDRAFT_213979 [[Candida] arabinofermentans NRRL YB-2248]
MLKFNSSDFPSEKQEELNTPFLISLILELIQVVIEQIWYHRLIYPKESFQKARSFQLEVYTSRHPEVKHYLKNLSLKLKGLIETGNLERVFVEVYNESRPKTTATRSYMNDENNDNNIKERYGISFKGSVLFEILRSGANAAIEFDPVFKSSLVFSELRAYLYSVIQELTVLASKDDGADIDSIGENGFDSIHTDETRDQWDSNQSNSESLENKKRVYGGCSPRLFSVLISVDKQKFPEFSASEDWLIEKTQLDSRQIQRKLRETNGLDEFIGEESSSIPNRNIGDVDLKKFKSVNLGYLNIESFRVLL